MTTMAFVLIQVCEDEKIILTQENGKLRWDAPAGAMTPDLQKKLEENETDVLAVLGMVEPWNKKEADFWINLAVSSEQFLPDRRPDAATLARLHEAKGMIGEARDKKSLAAVRRAVSNWLQIAATLPEQWEVLTREKNHA